MNKTIKVLFLTFVVFALSMTAITAYGTEASVAVASTPFQTHQGETFSTTIYIPDNANIVDFDITLKYDTNLITLENIQENEDIKGTVIFNAETAGIIRLNYTRTSANVNSYLPILDLTFSVKDDIGVAVYDCLTVDKTQTYVAHKLNNSGALEKVDFSCDFSELIIYEMGDVDLSCTVDIGDATYIRRHLAQFDGALLSDFKLSLADTYSDGIVDIADAVCLQRHLAKLDVVYGNRVNINFYTLRGEKYLTKSVLYNGTLNNIPMVPQEDGFVGGLWSQSATEYIAPSFENITTDITLYAYYEGGKTSEAVAYYKRMLTEQYYSGDLANNLSSDLNLRSNLYYQDGYYANLVWSSDCNYIINSTTGEFTKPTYPQKLVLTAKIISYDSNDKIEAEDSISFEYSVPGEFITPTKAEVAKWIYHYFTDKTDNKYRVNYDVKLIAKLNNVVIPVEGSSYDNFEIRLDWYQNINGSLVPISKIERTTSSQINDYVAVASFNGKPLEDDGKIYIDDVEVTAIEQIEIKNYIIDQIAANMGTLATDGTVLWNNDTVYGTKITWETGNADIAYVTNNVIKLKNDAISGSTLPLNARVSYAVDDGAEEFVLSYNLTVSCDNTIIKAPENMDPELYKAIKSELEENLGYRGDLTSAALANVKFVNLDLSEYPDITSLRGLSYCVNLRTLNISGLKITDGTMNQISTLSYLEAFIARGCELDNLSDGGTPTLKNAVNLKMIDLTDNNFTNLDSVFANNIKYGRLREVYLSSNKLTNINALNRAPMINYLSLSDNGLTTEGTASIANYPYLCYLSLADNKIDSVENLTNLKYLTELRLQNNEISDVRMLRSLVNLEILYLSNNKIKDIGFINSLTNLQLLYVNDNEISDVSSLTSLTELEIINISNNKISSLSVLRNYTGTLTEIYAENNNLIDFSFINGASKLHILMLAGNKLELAQSKMSSWLSGLTEMQVLTLSDIKLNDLSFLSEMDKLVRLDVANCGLKAVSGEESNIALIADKYATLKVLNISNNDMSGSEDEILCLRDATLLTVLYADNICDDLDIETLTYSMAELKYISLENCGITSASWLSKYDKLAYVDLAENNISEVDLDVFLSNASQKTIKELYLDTNVNCVFANAYRVADFGVEKLSLEGVSVDKVENLPYLDNIKYLNLSNTGLTNLVGDDVELADMYSIERYNTVETLDISYLESDISVLENMKSLKTVYAVGTVDSKLFYEDNLHALQRMHKSGITCYLYDKQTVYVPTATKEGTDILNLIEDFSCDITVAADNIISDNNPFIIDEINDYDITWTLSNSVNYEIVDNHISVKDYSRLEDETLTVTAQITVYPDQAPVTREFTINTHILRANTNYFDVNAEGYSEQLTRDSVFSYDVTLKAAPTEGFTNLVKPVEDSIDYTYTAIAENGAVIPYVNVITVGNNHSYTINSAAPLGATITIDICASHIAKDGSIIEDIEHIAVPVTIASRTYAATFVMNGGTITDANGISREKCNFVEDSLIFASLNYSRPGYTFSGWYTDAGFTNLFSADGVEAVMPSKDITLYAKWTALNYTVYFDANGGSVETSKMSALSDVALGTLPTPTRTYYTFNGWYTAASGGTKVTAETKFARTESLTLYAQWTLNSFVVTFNANGGSVSTTSLRAYCGKALGTLPTPTRTGFTFNGWYTAASGGTKVTSSTTYSTAKDITLYAQWTVNSYTVSWSTGTGYSITVKRTGSPNGRAATGNISSGAKVYYGDTLSITYAAATGYSITSKGSTSVTVTGNVTSSTIYASASANQYTYSIVYKSSNGTSLGSSSATYYFGTTNTITAPAKTGYNTPSSQSVKWDATSKTITFTYSPKSVSTSQTMVSDKAWWVYNSKTNIWYTVKVEYQNRTSSSVQVRVVWTNTIKAGAWYGYGQYFNATLGGKGSGDYQLCTNSTWASSSSSNRSKTTTTNWVTVPVSATQTSISVSGSWWDNCSRSGSWSNTFAIPAY
ncbi:MAG: InlB B-repeat-containing protein [Clostridia bacterium]|nr:InlB B-repeat-containing protein [Clostridia bacterium]